MLSGQQQIHHLSVHEEDILSFCPSVQDATYCLCSACCGRNDVVEYGTTGSPVTSCTRVNSLLFCSCGVNSAHQTLFDTERVIYDFNQRCQAVCCTGCIGNDIHVLSVCLVVYANNKVGVTSSLSQVLSG